MNCTTLRDLAPELALDELTGEERAEAISHLAECEACRALVAELAAVADSLLLLAPAIEPPPGFESRVLARGTVRERRRPGRWAVAAAIVALVVGLGVGSIAGGRDEGPALPAAGILRAADGAASGSVVIADGPDRMTCVFEDPRFQGEYAVQVVLDDGDVADVGTFTTPGSPWSWTVALSVDAGDVRRVEVLGEGGVVRATADVG